MLRIPFLVIFSSLVATQAFAEPVRLTISKAEIDGTKLNRAPSERSTTPYSDLACYALPGLRHLAASCGVHLEADGVTRLPSPPLPEKAPVDPMVKLVIGDRVIRTYPVPSTLTPRWEYSVVLDSEALSSEGQGALVLLDWVAPEQEVELGRTSVKLQTLLRPGAQTISVGPAKLHLNVERVGAQAPRFYSFDVPATKQIAELAQNASTRPSGRDYVAVPVAEGEVVSIEASGTVQPDARKFPDRVAGPDGVPTIESKIQYNQPGFRNGENHAALIAQLGMQSMLVGSSKSFVANTAGLLVLAINDLKTLDNGGAFHVSVTVSLPTDAPEEMDEDAGPVSLSPRVVQQVVDNKLPEFVRCFENVDNPNGSVVLQIVITANGEPVAAVESASPGLRTGAECMAAQVSKLKFPDPRGSVVVRYPMRIGR